MHIPRNRLSQYDARRFSSRPGAPRELSGKWVAWDRDQTRIVASGDTFEEVKEAAGAAGESAVLMARIPAHTRSRFGRPALYTVAVFISQMT